MSLINNRMTYRVVQDIRAKSIRHIQRLPLAYLDRHSSGDIVSRIIADADILSDGLLLGFTQLFSGVVTIAVTLEFMFSKNVWITLLVILLTPLSFVVAKFISTHSYSMFRRQSEARGRQTALIEEMIGSQKVVRAFGYEEKASARFAAVNEELKNYSQQAVFYSSLYQSRHALCQQRHLCGRRAHGRVPHPAGGADGRRTFRALVVCQPVYEALQ